MKLATMLYKECSVVKPGLEIVRVAEKNYITKTVDRADEKAFAAVRKDGWKTANEVFATPVGTPVQTEPEPERPSEPEQSEEDSAVEAARRRRQGL